MGIVSYLGFYERLALMLHASREGIRTLEGMTRMAASRKEGNELRAEPPSTADVAACSMDHIFARTTRTVMHLYGQQNCSERGSFLSLNISHGPAKVFLHVIMASFTSMEELRYGVGNWTDVGMQQLMVCTFMINCGVLEVADHTCSQPLKQLGSILFVTPMLKHPFKG